MAHPSKFQAAYERALQVTRLRQHEIAERLGHSRITVGRWRMGRTVPGLVHLRGLVALVQKEHPEEADALAKAAGQSIAALGLTPPAAPPRAAGRIEIESIVYAAADAIDVAPRVTKRALLAALERMIELDVAAPALVDALREPRAKPAARERRA